MKRFYLFLTLCLTLPIIVCSMQPRDEESDFQSKTFSVQKGGLLEIDVEPGAISIEAWDKDEVSVEAEGIDEQHPDRLVMAQSNNTVRVKYRDRRSHTNRLKFTFKVPSKFNIDAHTSGGSIKQKSILTGDFKAESGGGSVNLNHIIGKVEIETGGGSIHTNIIDGNATIRTGGGSITTGTVKGDLRVKTGGGSITVLESGGKVDASTGGGSIKTEKAEAWIELSTGGGSVVVRGAKYGAQVRTGGGSVEMQDIVGVVDVTTGGGSVQCELIPGSSGSSQIKTGGGEIQFSLPENAKAVVKATINRGHGWGRHHNTCTIRSDFKADSYEKNDDGEDVSAVYTLNGGGPTITLETSESDIRILKMTPQ